jgi:hypothetical protein
MDLFSYVHKSVELLFQILGLVEVWTCRSLELLPGYFKSFHPVEFSYLIVVFLYYVLPYFMQAQKLEAQNSKMRRVYSLWTVQKN